MYSGLRKEVYILCFGRFVTAMGSLIWPMLTLILKSKLHYGAEQIALWFLLFGILQIPFGLVGGKMTDNYNKRNLILFFDLISVALYITTAILPLSTVSLCIYYIGSLFQHMEWPAYDALIAELTKDKEREKAYSLMYLAANTGVVFAPTLGGLLFNKYLWLSFLLCGIAVFSSTMLIFFFIPKDIDQVANDNMYEDRSEGRLGEVIRSRKILLFYMFLACMAITIYNQFNYTLPMQMDEIFGMQGAVFFGMLTSVNGIVVITTTPIFTQLTLKWHDLDRIIVGIFIQVIGLSTYFFYNDELIFYIISMVVLTIGEVIHTLGMNPYISKRIPSSHRGRITAIANMCMQVTSSVGNTMVGKIIVLYTFKGVWVTVFIAGMILTALLLIYRQLDRRRFSRLYEKN
jgi:MFS family permease